MKWFIRGDKEFSEKRYYLGIYYDGQKTIFEPKHIITQPRELMNKYDIYQEIIGDGYVDYAYLNINRNERSKKDVPREIQEKLNKIPFLSNSLKECTNVLDSFVFIVDDSGMSNPKNYVHKVLHRKGNETSSDLYGGILLAQVAMIYSVEDEIAESDVVGFTEEELSEVLKLLKFQLVSA